MLVIRINKINIIIVNVKTIMMMMNISVSFKPIFTDVKKNHIIPASKAISG